MGFFLEEIEEPSSEKTTQRSERLRDLDLIGRTSLVLGDTGPINKLVIRRKLFNKKGEVYLKGYGWVTRMPGFTEGYLLDTQSHTVDVINDKSEDGKYSLDIGIGGDIKVPLKVTVRASEDKDDVEMLMKNQETYRDAIRNTAEQIMGIIIRDQCKIDQSNITEGNINKIRQMNPFDMLAMSSGNTNISPEKVRQVLKLTTKLLKNYGIIFEGISFPKIDMPKEIDDILSKGLTAANQRQIDKAKADNDVYIAKQEAEAVRISRKAEIEMLKIMKEGLGLSEEQVAQILRWKAIPSNAVAIIGNEKGNTADFVAANMINQSQNQDQNTTGGMTR